MSEPTSTQIEFADGPLAGTCHELHFGFPAPPRLKLEGHWYRQGDDGRYLFEFTEIDKDARIAALTAQLERVTGENERLHKLACLQSPAWASVSIHGDEIFIDGVGSLTINEGENDRLNAIENERDDLRLKVKELESQLAAARGADELPVNVDELAKLPGAVKFIGIGRQEDTVEFDRTVIVDRHGTITICNGKIRKATMGQFRQICALLLALGIAPAGTVTPDTSK